MGKEIKQDEKFEQIEEALGRSESFIEKNYKLLIQVFCAVIVIFAAVVGYNKFIKAPKAKEAEAQIFGAQRYFEQDSFRLALNGNIAVDTLGEGSTKVAGFLEIIKNYGSTPAGNLANFYAGLCYLHLGEYENAISYLKNFTADDLLLSNMAIANMGDAYMELGNYKAAAEQYNKAAASKVNEFSTPLFLKKNGLALEKSGDFAAAVALYKRIEKEFPRSFEASDIEKYITRAEISMKK